MAKPTSNLNEKNLVLKRAQSAMIAHDFVTAARLYKQLLADDPSNVDYLQELGAIYVKSGEDEKAIPYYEQIITFYPHHIDSMTSLGAIYRRLKRYEESTSILERALEEGRQIPSVNYNLGFTYREMGHWDDAIEAFNSVISENPSDVLAYNHLGAIYMEKKDYQKSIASFKRGLQIDHNHPILNYNLARCYEKAKLYGDSIRCYENALKTKPGWIECIHDFSNVLIKCQKTKQAADVVKNSILMHPNDVKLLCMLGNVYLNQYDFDQAETTFRKATKIDDKDVPSLSGLSTALEKNEKHQEALTKISKAYDLAPDNLEVKKQYAYTLLSANEVETAGATVRELMNSEGSSKDPEVFDLMAQYYICQNQPDKAQECYDKINQINHHYKKHLLNSAERYQQVGNSEAAEKYAKQFVTRDSNNPSGYNMLGKIYSEQGNVEGALEVYEKSRTLWKPNILADKKIESLGAQAVYAPDVLEAQPVEETVATEPLFEEAAVIEAGEVVEEENEEFDFSQMGDSVPMAEALVEEEKSFFDELDDATGEAELADPEEEEPEEEKTVVPDYTHTNPFDSKSFGDLEDESLSPFDENNNLEPKSDAESLTGKDFEEENDAKEEKGTGDFSDFSDIPDDDFDFEQFDEVSAKEKEEKPEPDYSSDYSSENTNSTASSAPSYDDGYQPQPSPSYPQPQPSAPAEAPVPYAAPEPDEILTPQPDLSQAMQQNAMDSANFAMETAFNAQRFAQELAYQQKMLEEKLKEVQNSAAAAQQKLDDMEKMQAEKEDEPVTEEMGTGDASDEGTEEMGTGDVSDEATEEMGTGDVSDEGTEEKGTGDISDEATEEMGTGDVSDEVTEEMGTGDISEEATEEMGTGDISDEQTEETNPVISAAEKLLPTIEKILSDKEAEQKYAEEIEMFKKLLSLGDYLPEPAKTDFMESPVRMKLEYLIAKLSGKPGLLETAASLRKTGVIGITDDTYTDDDFVPSNHQLRKVLKYMKKLTDSLEDRELAKSLNASVDDILEKIEVVESDVQIFN